MDIDNGSVDVNHLGYFFIQHFFASDFCHGEGVQCFHGDHASGHGPASFCESSSSALQARPRSLTYQTQGFCFRPVDLGTLVGALRSQGCLVRWVYGVCGLSNSSSCGPGCSDCFGFSVFHRILRLCTASCRRWHPRGHLESGRSRHCDCSIRGCHLLRSDPWSHRVKSSSR